MAANDIGFYLYTDDDGDDYKVRLTERVAANGGFTAAAGTEPLWRNRGRRKMRHVGVRFADGRRGQVPCPARNGGLYLQIGQTVSFSWPDATTEAFAELPGTIVDHTGERGGD